MNTANPSDAAKDEKADQPKVIGEFSWTTFMLRIMEAKLGKASELEHLNKDR
jgi:hypothetical protein